MIAILTAVIAIVALSLMSYILLKRLDKKEQTEGTQPEQNNEQPIEEEINTDPVDLNNTHITTTIDRNTT